MSKTTGSQRRKSWPGVSLKPNPFTISGGTKQVPGETATSGRREGEGRQGLLESRDQDEAEWPSSARTNGHRRDRLGLGLGLDSGNLPSKVSISGKCLLWPSLGVH